MSLWPITCHVLDRQARHYQPVIIKGYQQYISAGGFRALNLRAGYKYQRTFKSLKVYDCLYILAWSSEDLWTYPVVGEPMDLYEYYDMIGYDRKLKKINGQTMLQRIKAYMESLDVQE